MGDLGSPDPRNCSVGKGVVKGAGSERPVI